MLVLWMNNTMDDNNTKWSNGLRFRQFKKYNPLFRKIKQSFYKAMFGIEPRVELIISSLSSDFIKNP